MVDDKNGDGTFGGLDCGIDFRMDVEGNGVERGRNTEDLRAGNFVGVILNDRFERDIRRCLGLVVEIRVGAGDSWPAGLYGGDVEGRRCDRCRRRCSWSRRSHKRLRSHHIASNRQCHHQEYAAEIRLAINMLTHGSPLRSSLLYPTYTPGTARGFDKFSHV